MPHFYKKERKEKKSKKWGYGDLKAEVYNLKKH